MTDRHHPDATTAEESRRNRRAVLIRGGLAVIAVAGIGVAVTAAAWTDQALFSADASAATFDLRASLNATGPWTDNESASNALVIPVSASHFGDLVPGSGPHSVDVFVKNDSSVEADLSVTSATSGPLFTTTGSTVTVNATPASTTLAAGAVGTITVELTPGAMPATLQGATGSVLVTVTASTT